MPLTIFNRGISNLIKVFGKMPAKVSGFVIGFSICLLLLSPVSCIIMYLTIILIFGLVDERTK